MQTRKKVDGKNARELGSPRISRHQKKLSENIQNQSKKVSDLITSSVRKQKSGWLDMDIGTLIIIIGLVICTSAHELQFIEPLLAVLQKDLQLKFNKCYRSETY